MKMYLSLLPHLIFLGLFSGYLTSNPDSVIVESPEDNEEQTAKIPAREGLSKITEIPRNVIVKVMQPVVIGSEVYWKEIDSGSFSRMRASSQYRDSWRYFRPSRFNFRPTEKSVIDADIEMPVSGDRVKIPQSNRGIIFDDRSQPQNTFRGYSGTWFRDDESQMPQNTFRGSSGTKVPDDESQMPPNTFRGSSGTKVPDDESQMPQNTYRGSSGDMAEDDGSQMPCRGNCDTNAEDKESQVAQSNPKGNRGKDRGVSQSQVPESNPKEKKVTDGGVDQSQVPQNNYNGKSETGGGNDQSQAPQNNPKGNSENDSNLKADRETNNEDDISSMPDDKFEDNDNRETVRNTFHVSTESDEAFFEDDHHTKPDANSPERLTADSNFFAGIVNDFAFKLVESLNLESNFVISPLSMYIALSMCYLASDGRTKAQIEQTLGMNANSVHDEHLHHGIKNLISLVTKRTSGYEIFAANGMFLGKNFTAEPSFEQNIKNYYRAEIKNLDFSNPDLSLEFINKWVSDRTNNMITKMINSPPPWQTRLLLLNAIFFKGVWKTQFPIHLTNTGNFHLLNDTNKEVPFMTLYDENFPIFRSNEHRHTFIKLPYEGDQVSMVIALPFTAREKPISSITDQILCHMRDAMVNSKLDVVAIPKFREEYRISLIRPLQKLGILDIFNRNTIDFRKLRKQNDLYVSGVMHKSVVEIDEVGTKASASTAVGLVPLSYTNRTKFVASHPFAFYIIHEPTGLVLFYGKIFDFESAPTVSTPNNRREENRGRPRPVPRRRG